MDLWDATNHKPSDRTYLIQIALGNSLYDKSLDSVVEGKTYARRFIYKFADLFPGETRKGILFDKFIAERVIEDFRVGREGCGTLLVHCSQGQNRSPALGIALNDIFELGHDSEALRQKYDAFNQWVYKVMLETAGLPAPEEVSFLPYRPRSSLI